VKPVGAVTRAASAEIRRSGGDPAVSDAFQTSPDRDRVRICDRAESGEPDAVAISAIGPPPPALPTPVGVGKNRRSGGDPAVFRRPSNLARSTPDSHMESCGCQRVRPASLASIGARLQALSTPVGVGFPIRKRRTKPDALETSPDQGRARIHDRGEGCEPDAVGISAIGPLPPVLPTPVGVGKSDAPGATLPFPDACQTSPDRLETRACSCVGAKESALRVPPRSALVRMRYGPLWVSEKTDAPGATLPFPDACQTSPDRLETRACSCVGAKESALRVPPRSALVRMRYGPLWVSEKTDAPGATLPFPTLSKPRPIGTAFGYVIEQSAAGSTPSRSLRSDHHRRRYRPLWASDSRFGSVGEIRRSSSVNPGGIELQLTGYPI
jgi:hypothetical protein